MTFPDTFERIEEKPERIDETCFWKKVKTVSVETVYPTKTGVNENVHHMVRTAACDSEVIRCLGKKQS
jgi:hypothetical protein